MKDSTKITLLTVTTVILMMVNVALVCMLWFARGPVPGEGRAKGGPSAAIIRELDFKGDQLREFEKLRDEHHAAMISINGKERRTHDALFDLIRAGQDSTMVSDSLINEIVADRKQTEQVTFHHIEQVRKLCTPEQQKKFDDIILNLMARLGQGPPPGGRP